MANKGNKIYITISDKRGSGNGTGNDALEDTKTADKKKKSKFDAVFHEAMHYVLNEAKQAINYQVAHIGVRTGDYVAQQNAQVAVNMAYKGFGILASTYAGVKAGGLYGAAIGFGVGTLTTATNMAHQYFDYRRQITFQNAQIDMLKERSGNYVNNGSR